MYEKNGKRPSLPAFRPSVCAGGMNGAFALHRMPYRRYERRRSATVFGIRPETALFSSEERNNLSEFFLTWECVPPEICTVVRLQRNVCPMKKIAYYVVPVLLCLIAGLVAGRLQAESVAVWYPLLVKPALTPPDIAFPIAWGIIYLCMGLSLGRVLRYGDKRYVTLWFLQLAVNFLWSVFFFYLRSPLAGFVDILLLDALVIVYICRVRHRTPSAAWLFAPYVLWILFATYLNGYILVKNPDNKIVTQNVLTTNIDTLSNSKNRQTMKHTLPQLPYKTEALAPKMSAETFEYHYGKHLQTYIDNLNKLIEGTPYAEMPLDEIVRKADGGVFNNAAQTWNHTFFFLRLTPDQQPMPEKLAAALARDFGSVEAFREAFTKAAVGLFGSGWTWLAQQPDGKLVIVAESNAGNPMTRGLKPLLTVDVWEHAYYIDYRNRRAEFVKNWWDLVDWQKVADRL